MRLSYVKLYADTSGAVDLLSDAEAGRLFKAILHNIAGVVDELPGQEKLVYAMLKAQFERDAEAYELYSEKQRKNGEKGGRPKKPTGFSENPKNPLVFLETQKSQDKDNNQDNNKDKDNNKNKEGSIPRARTRFTPPTVEEVSAYAAEKGWTEYQFSAERFVDFYTSKGWRVGRDTMRDWKAAARGWISRRDMPQEVKPKDNPALNYAQREYKDEDYGESFFEDLSKYAEGG